MNTCPLLELCKYGKGIIYASFTQITIIIMSLVFGTLLMWKPRKVIGIQTALYRPFNWKLEPISMEKEIRNVRIMGAMIFILGILSIICMAIL